MSAVEIVFWIASGLLLADIVIAGIAWIAAALRHSDQSMIDRIDRIDRA